MERVREMIKTEHFILDHFQGPLDLLVCLVQKEEIGIETVFFHDLLLQFFSQEKDLNKGGDFVHSLSYLMLLKSRKLLPQEKQWEEEELLEDPRFEVIHHLVDYCKFKQAAKELNALQESQQECYFRGFTQEEYKKPMGIEHVSLEDLAQMFQGLMSRCRQEKGQIYEETWLVSDKITSILSLLTEQGELSFSSLFLEVEARMEMIVIFLAVLELMKMGKISIQRNASLGDFILSFTSEGST